MVAADMWALYRVDLTDPCLPVAVVQRLIERLASEPASMHRAEALGGPEHFRWGATEAYLSNIQDNTLLTAHTAARQKGRLRDSLKAWRPETRETRHKEVPSTVSTDDESGMLDFLSTLSG